ncbi:MAG: hypothetical protein HND57_01865 [Planctomycetes bacterium]|nr:hypothetical protein [Planctomycetota bacterium]
MSQPTASKPDPSPLTRPSRPEPVLAHEISLALPGLPDAMVGRRILHLSDVHIRRYRPRFRRMIARCARLRPDFVWMTGDYMTVHGDEQAALTVMADLLDVFEPPGGIFGCFGNHDSAAFKRLALKRLHRCHWLEHEAVTLPEYGITLMGTSTPCDVLACIMAARQAEQTVGSAADSYRILLGHEPGILITCAELGIEWTLAGHTHGGQLRFGLPFALHNSTDIPGSHSSGILRCRDSVCTISRGLGESYFDVRLLCPTHLPMYTLRRGPLPGSHCRRMDCVQWW